VSVIGVGLPTLKTGTDTEMFFDNRREEVRVKIGRAYGGCPGIRERRRTQRAAKSHGELLASVDPWISEWGNPSRVKSGYHTLNT
jgi:hypothetical protein